MKKEKRKNGKKESEVRIQESEERILNAVRSRQYGVHRSILTIVSYLLQSTIFDLQSITYPAKQRRFRLSRHNDYYIKGAIPYSGTRIPLMPLYGMPHSCCGGTGGIQEAGDAHNAQPSTSLLTRFTTRLFHYFATPPLHYSSLVLSSSSSIDQSRSMPIRR